MDKKPSISTSGGTSLVVRQFLALANGEVMPHEPQNAFRTVSVEADEHYCTKCFNNGLWDVWSGIQDGIEFRVGRCRVCGWEKTL